MVGIVIKKVVHAPELEARKTLVPKPVELDHLRTELDAALAMEREKHAEELLEQMQRLAEEIDIVSCDKSSPGTDGWQ